MFAAMKFSFILFGLALLGMGQAREDTCVGLGGTVGDQAARPQTEGAHGVDLGGEERDLGLQIDPGQHGDHRRQRSVCLARPLERVAHDVAAERLQDDSRGGGDTGAGNEPTPRHVGNGEQFEGGEEDAEVDQGGDDDGDDLGHEAVTSPCRRQTGEHRGADDARAEHEQQHQRPQP